jgi:hypothetical protein
LLVIESWLKKGFEDEELKCSSRIKEFALTIVGSRTMEAKAREIVEMVGNPEYVRRSGRSINATANGVFRSAYANQGAVPGYDAIPVNGHKM